MKGKGTRFYGKWEGMKTANKTGPAKKGTMRPFFRELHSKGPRMLQHNRARKLFDVSLCSKFARFRMSKNAQGLFISKYAHSLTLHGFQPNPVRQSWSGQTTVVQVRTLATATETSLQWCQDQMQMQRAWNVVMASDCLCWPNRVPIKSWNTGLTISENCADTKRFFKRSLSTVWRRVLPSPMTD